MKDVKRLKLWTLLFLTMMFFILPLRVSCSSPEEDSFYVAQKAFFDGFYQASITLFEKFIQDFPDSKNIGRAKLYIAKAYYFQKKYLSSLQILKELLVSEDSKDFVDEIYYWLSQIYLEGKNYTQALEYAQKIIKEFENSSLYWWGYYLKK